MQIRHDRIREKGLEQIDALYLHLVCEHGRHPHSVDHLDIDEMRDVHREEHEAHVVDGELRLRVQRFIECYDAGDPLRIANAMSGLRDHVKRGIPTRREPRRPRLLRNTSDARQHT